MEIAFFTDSYLPTHDGVATVVSGLARALGRAGHGVTVFAPHPDAGAPPDHTVIDGVPVIRSRSVPLPVYTGYRWAVFPFGQLWGERFGRRFDVVHVHTPGIMGNTGYLAARRWRKPLVGTYHTNVFAMQESFPDRTSVRWFLRIAWIWTLGTYWRCDRATAPTAAAAETLESHARKPFDPPVEVIPNGIEVDRFRPGIAVPDWRTRCGLPTGPLVTYLGRLTRDKGVHRFLDAVATLDRPDAGAVVGGSGPEEGAVRARIATDPRLRDRVRFLGPVAETEKPALLAQSDLFVLPSTADTSSIALLEAMASGAACIASDEGGPGEIVVDGVLGRRVPVRSPGPLAAAIQELADDPATRQRYGAAGRAFVARTASIDTTAQRFIALYDVVRAGRRTVDRRHAA